MWISTPPQDYEVIVFPNGEQSFVHRAASLSNVHIGRYSYVNANTHMFGLHPVKIGAFCSISTDVYCCTYESHQTTYATTYPLKTILGLDISYSECVDKPDGVTIGNDVYIGQGARIMPGIVIGDGCVIGARAVVTKNCDPFGIYVGVPAKEVNKRFPQDIVDQLLEIQWWRWPLEKIQRNVAFFNLNLNVFKGNLRDEVNE
jgi:virginiamycin A acetyltransferase